MPSYYVNQCRQSFHFFGPVDSAKNFRPHGICINLTH